MKLLVSGYGTGEDKGLFAYEMSKEGTLKHLQTYITSGFATHVEVADSYWFVSMKPDAKDTGGITVFKDGQFLAELLTPGVSYAHLCVDFPYIYAISYHEGHITSFILENDILRLITDIVHEGTSINPKRQNEPHPHFVGMTLDKKYVYCVDLGLDKIIYYNHENGVLNHVFSVSVDVGSGPRQMVFLEQNKLAYLVTEIANTVQVYSYESERMTKLQSLSTIPIDYSEMNSLAAVRINSSGNQLLVSNRGHDSIALFDINEDGLLRFNTRIACGKTPRDATFVADEFVVVAAQDSDVLQVFSLNEGEICKVEEIIVKSPVDIAIFEK